MAHHHLALELFHGLQRDADHNDNGRTAEAQVDLLVKQRGDL